MVKRTNTIRVISRSVLVFMATIAMVGGVTFATLQSQTAIVKGNTIQTASANLQLSANGTNYSNSIDGYVFGNLIPGGAAVPTSGYPVYLKNSGSVPLALKLSVGSSTVLPANIDASKVHIILNPSAGGAPQNILLSDLLSVTGSGVALSQATRLTAGQSMSFLIQVAMDQDAVSGSSASIDSIDFNFGATAVN